MPDTVVTYGDAVITTDSLSLLRPGGWLDDNLIAFYFEYLTQTQPDSKQLLLCPSTVFFMNEYCADVETLRETLEPILTPEVELILLPINDNTDCLSAGGSHWTFLAYLVKEKKSLFFDSIPESGSIQSAMKAAEKLDALFGRRSSLQAREGPRQRNSSDCGVYVLATAEFIHRTFLKERSLELLSDSTLCDTVEQTGTAVMRERVRDLVTNPRYDVGAPGIL